MTVFRKLFMFTTVLVGLSVTALQAQAGADYAREKRWADEITPAIVVGEVVYLTQKNQHKFLAIQTEADEAKAGVVVVHGMGIHPDWGMINTLRERLADEGYTTLSIQMPVLAADASYKEYPQVFPEAAERLELAVAYLRQRGYKRIAIASHSNGTRMSRVYMANNPADVSAWASISMTQGDTYDGVTVPVLDIYGENDLPHVLSAVKKRKDSLKGNPASRQRLIPATDHFFAGKEEEMVKAVVKFLDSLNSLQR
ncbi:DUF3530 family protein [Sulfuriflexus mobilis]|uniref:DUF3530 family protein n=1 Tax=Sulfuriflexus mobilis TaxID=1811807 RepID=UPI0018D5557C|nr:DUF3530 family protein [Sulfuriflexus mobilis]